MKGLACKHHPEPVEPVEGYAARVTKMVHGYTKPALAAWTEYYPVVWWSSVDDYAFEAAGTWWTPSQYRAAYHECDDLSSVSYDITLIYFGEPVR